MDNWFKNNNVLKILSLLLSIMLWLVVSLDTSNTPQSNPLPNGRGENTYYYDANVVPIYNDVDYAVDIEDDQIQVSLKGNKELIEEMRSKENIDKGQFFIDIRNYEPGTYEVPVYYSGFPQELEVGIEPATVKVVLEEKHRKEFNVNIEKVGEEAEGYQTGDPIIKPKKVHVTGTKDRVEEVAMVKAIVDIENVMAPINQEVPLKAYDKNGNEVKVDISPQTVEVQIPVTSPYATVPLTFKIINYPPQGYAISSIEQIPKDITLYGSKDDLSKYTFYTGPNLDLSNVTQDQTIRLDIPLENGLLKIEPEFVEFNVNIVKSTTKTFTNVPIEINGLNNGFNAELNEQSVSITLEGAEEILANLKNDDLQAFIDITNLPVGEHEVAIQYNVPLFVKRIGDEQFVKVKITKE